MRHVQRLAAGQALDGQGFPGQQQAGEIGQGEGRRGARPLAVKQGRVVAGGQDFDADLELIQVRRRPGGLFPGEEGVAQGVHRQAQGEKGLAGAIGVVFAGGVEASAGLPDPAAEFLHRPGAGVVAALLFHIAGEAAAHAFRPGGAGQGLEGRQPAPGLAPQADGDAQAMGAVEEFIADAVGFQNAAAESAGGVNVAAGPGVVADGHAKAAVVGILDEAVGHLDGGLHLVLVVEIEGGVGQHHRAPGGSQFRVPAGVEQRQLARGVAQSTDDLGLGLGEAGGVVVNAALLLLLQHGDGQRRHGKEEGEEGRAEKDAQPEGGQPGQECLHRGPPALAWSDQRKPRMGTFSMRSKVSSSSRKASRMVLMCFRMLSRLRPLFTTAKSSS